MEAEKEIGVIIRDSELRIPTWGATIGRFQVPTLTDGHRALFHELRAHPRKLVLVGRTPCPYPTSRYPLPFRDIEQMIRAEFDRWETGVTILPAYDQPSDPEWSELLDGLLRWTTQGDVSIYYGRDSFARVYSGRYKDNLVGIAEADGPSGTQIREGIHMAPSSPLMANAFRAGVIYARNLHRTRVHYTVDVIAYRVRNGDLQVLVGEKKGFGFVLPGGFVDPEDPTFALAAHREFEEETRMKADSMIYLEEMTLRDWRYETEPLDRVNTVVFVTEEPKGTAMPADDLDAVDWFSVDFAMEKLLSSYKSMIMLFMKRHFPDHPQPEPS